MKERKTTFRGLRTTERTNTLINALIEVCNNADLRVNGGDDVDGSAILISPYERIAHCGVRDDRETELIDLLNFQRLKDNTGMPIPREKLAEIVKEALEKDGLR